MNLHPHYSTGWGIPDTLPNVGATRFFRLESGEMLAYLRHQGVISWFFCKLRQFNLQRGPCFRQAQCVWKAWLGWRASKTLCEKVPLQEAGSRSPSACLHGAEQNFYHIEWWRTSLIEVPGIENSTFSGMTASSSWMKKVATSSSRPKGNTLFISATPRAWWHATFHWDLLRHAGDISAPEDFPTHKRHLYVEALMCGRNSY